MKSQILFWLLAAPDGDAKNFSIQILPQGQFKLAPLYDVMSIWPIEGPGPNQWSIHKLKLAMAFWGKNKHYQHKEVLQRHLVSTAKICGLKADVATMIEDIVAQMPGVLECAVVGIPDEKTGEAVKLVVVRKDPALTEEQVMEHCRHNLTGYKRPKSVEFRDSLPTTNVGKILRRELRDEELRKLGHKK